jgi:predicted transcriptional regulator
MKSMARFTVSLSDDVVALIDARASKAGVSRSRWVAETVERDVGNQWPAEIIAMIGAWPDFPFAEEIRQRQMYDVPRARIGK